MIDGSRSGELPGQQDKRHEAAIAFGLDPAMYDPQPRDRMGMPYRMPYQLGLYLAVNAIPGSTARLVNSRPHNRISFGGKTDSPIRCRR